MRVKLGWIPRLFSILFIIAMFVCLNVLWTTSSLSHLINKSTFNSSQFRLSVDSVFIANATGRADAIKTALSTNDDLKFLETGYLSKNISVDTAGASLARPQHFLTTLQLGQLGNNMFQYAGLLGLAKMNGRTPFFPISSLVRQVFKISHVASIKEASSWRRLPEANHGKYEPVYEHLPEGNLTLAAYLQSYKYFQAIEKEIRQEFQFREGIQRRAMGLFKFLRPRIGTRTPIGVHVRRFDLLTQKEIKLGSLTAPKSYFQQAFAWMKSRHGDVVFLVASDDPEWCKENILQGDDVILMPHAMADVHLCALAACRHVIMSVGTFGWWAGWLGGGDVIYYTKPHAPGSPKDKGFNKDDFFPLHWIGIGDGPEPSTESSQFIQAQGQPQSSGVRTGNLVGLNTAIGERAMVGTEGTSGLAGLPLGGTHTQQGIPYGLGNPVSSSGSSLNTASTSTNQVYLNELLSGQQKTVGVEHGLTSSMTITPNRQNVFPGLGNRSSINIQTSQQDLQQMLKNQELLQGTGLGQTLKPSSLTHNANSNGVFDGMNSPISQEIAKDLNVLVKKPAEVSFNPSVKLQSTLDMANAAKNSQKLMNPLVTTESSATVAHTVPSENAGSITDLNSAGLHAKPGKIIRDGLLLKAAEANPRITSGTNLDILGNVDATGARNDVEKRPDTIPYSDAELKLNSSILELDNYTTDLSSEALNALLSSTKLGESVKSTSNIADSANTMGLKLDLNTVTPMSNSNGGSQVVEKSRQDSIKGIMLDKGGITAQKNVNEEMK